MSVRTAHLIDGRRECFEALAFCAQCGFILAKQLVNVHIIRHWVVLSFVTPVDVCLCRVNMVDRT